jgi:hypothetical protein
MEACEDRVREDARRFVRDGDWLGHGWCLSGGVVLRHGDSYHVGRCDVGESIGGFDEFDFVVGSAACCRVAWCGISIARTRAGAMHNLMRLST